MWQQVEHNDYAKVTLFVTMKNRFRVFMLLLSGKHIMLLPEWLLSVRLSAIIDCNII